MVTLRRVLVAWGRSFRLHSMTLCSRQPSPPQRPSVSRPLTHSLTHCYPRLSPPTHAFLPEVKKMPDTMEPDASWEAIERAAGNRRALHSKITDLQKQRVQLKESIAKLAVNDVSAADKKLTDAIVSHSKKETLALTRRMQEVLPKELRAMVWQQYWAKGHPLVGEHKIGLFTEEYMTAEDFYTGYFDLLDATETPPGDMTYPRRSWDDLPTAAKPAFVGSEAAYEAMLEFLRYAGRDIWSGTKQLSASLSADVFHIGITALMLATSLHLYTDTDLQREACGLTGISHPHSIICPHSKEALKNLKRELHPLLKIPRGTLTSVDFNIQCCASFRHLENVLDIFKDSYETLLEQGINVTIMVCGDDEYVTDVCYDVRAEDYYELTLIEWRQKHKIGIDVEREQTHLSEKLRLLN
ncbi:hypothetical protein P154DRAFT_121115 [Amniculicola lignicola CBS 123094]|uniref:Uncharacterized protein n=1 Tax=Amniculicola lignicola CBS 123094 TaxID=1392246 RepID=A0A6A5X3Q6_9PLEO|nr:hypothetical protein P154DRAFT_121115 [Amniculicola lignicola CBS 123094]